MLPFSLIILFYNRNLEQVETGRVIHAGLTREMMYTRVVVHAGSTRGNRLRKWSSGKAGVGKHLFVYI